MLRPTTLTTCPVCGRHFPWCCCGYRLRNYGAQA